MHRPGIGPQRSAVSQPSPGDMNPNNPSVPITPMCDLCKASKPAVRCDRCDNQVFCLQCDDIFHRHPKRKAHLRKSVEHNDMGRPPSHQGTLPGHKVVAAKPFWKPQPDIPPRKKKPFSIFTNLMRGKSEVCIPEELEKRNTLTSKLGSLKRFIQNRPLPPLPTEQTSRQVPPFASGDEPKRNAFASLHNKSGSATSLSRAYPKDLSDWESEKDIGSNLQVNRMYPDRMASMNRHQSMMDLSRMTPQAYPPFIGGPFMPPFGAPFGGVAMPYGSMSYLNDPRTMPQPWGYAGSTGSFSNLNSSAEGEGKDTDSESTSRLPLRNAQSSNAAAAAAAASMRRCQSFAANQWNNMAYPYAPPQAFGYPGMPPYYLGGGSQWGSNQSMDAMGRQSNPPGARSQANLSNMDANRAIWYYHGRNKPRSAKVETETSDSDLDFAPRSRSRSDFRQGSRPHSNDRDQARHGFHGLRNSKSSAVIQENRRGRFDEVSRAHSLGASDADEFDEARHVHSRVPQPRRCERRRSPLEPCEDEYVDPASFVENRPDVDDDGMPPPVPPPPAKNLLRRSSYEQATRDEFEAMSQAPMSPPRLRRTSTEPQSSIPRLPAKKQIDRPQLKIENADACGWSPTEVKATEVQEKRDPSMPQVNEADPPRIRWSPSKQWTCIHCTFINPAGKRVCEVCCKTSFRDDSPECQQTDPQTGQKSVSQKSTPTPEAKPANKAVSKRREAATSSKSATASKSTTDSAASKEIDGFDYEFIKQQRAVEEELRRRLENERRIAAENAKLEIAPHNDENGTPHDTYETVEFTSEAESESDTESGRGGDESLTTKSLASRFEKKIQQSKENSPAVVGPYRRMMVDSNGTPKALSSIHQARSKFESTASQPRPRKSSLKARGDTSPNSSRSSIASSVEAARASQRESSEYQESQDSTPSARGKRGTEKMKTGTRKQIRTSDHEQSPGAALDESSVSEDSDEETFVETEPPPQPVTKPTPKQVRKSRESSAAHEKPIKPSGMETRLFKSVADLVDEQQRELEKENALHLMNAMKEGEAAGYTAEDVQVARALCGDANPVLWLKTNWTHMIETVIHLSSTYIAENSLKNVGHLSVIEAQAALRRKSGNIWNAVRDAVEQRQSAFQAISGKGPFKADDILRALRASQGNVDQALAQLSNSTMNAFLMKMYSAGAESLTRSPSESMVAPEEKIALWLENSNALSGSGSSTISSSQESLDFLADPDRQLQKLDKLMMKRQIQKKEDSRYKKYKERVAHAKQHHEGAMVAETGYLEKQTRPGSSVSSAETSASRMTNLEDVIEQKLQTGLNSILSVIETTLKKERPEVSDDDDDETRATSPPKQGGKERGSGSRIEKPRGTGSKSQSKDHEDQIAETVKTHGGVQAVRPKTKAGCKPKSPQHGTATESDDESQPTRRADVRYPPNVRSDPSSSRNGGTSQGTGGTKSKTAISGSTRVVLGQPESTPSNRAAERQGLGAATESEDSTDDRDYSEVELAIATLNQPPVTVMPPEFAQQEIPRESDDSEEEFEAAEEFLDAPQSPVIQQDSGYEAEHYNEALESRQELNQVAVITWEPVVLVSNRADEEPAGARPETGEVEQENRGATRMLGPTQRATENPGPSKAKKALQQHTNPGDEAVNREIASRAPACDVVANSSESQALVPAVPRDTTSTARPPNSSEPQQERTGRENAALALTLGPSHPSTDNPGHGVNRVDEDASAGNLLMGPTLPTTDNPGHGKGRTAVDSQHQSARLVAAGKLDPNASDERSTPSPLNNFVKNLESRTADGQFVSETVTINLEQRETVSPQGGNTMENEAQCRNSDQRPKERRSGSDDSGSETQGEDEADLNVDAPSGPGEVERYDAAATSRSGSDEEPQFDGTIDSEGERLSENGDGDLNDFAGNRGHQTRDMAAFLKQEDEYWAEQDQREQDDLLSDKGSSEHDATEEQEPAPASIGVDGELREGDAGEEFTEQVPLGEKEPAGPIGTDQASAASKSTKRRKVVRKLKSSEEKKAEKVAEVIGTPRVNGVADHHVYNSDDYSDISDESAESNNRRDSLPVSGNLGNQTAMMKVIRRSLEDLARLGGKPQKVTARHVVYRRPSIRRRSTIVVVDRGDGFGRSSEGDAIIIKPQGALEPLRVSGQELTKAILGMVAKQRTRPPPKKKVADASKLQQTGKRRPAAQYKQRQFNEKASDLVASGRVESIVQAQMVAELVDMNFDEEDAILASANSDSVYQAVLFLQQECNICYGTYPMSQMIALLHCAHVACQECLRTYFTIQIRDRNVGELRCPFCNEPDLSDENIEQNYFSNMSVLLKDLIDKETFDLFQKKLVERALIKDPNFRWCPQCSSGFITVAQQKAVTCPDCKKVSCADCKKIWRKEHQTLSCEEFDRWISRYEPDSAEIGLERYFEENGIQCPECKFRYALSRGGCMHFKCVQCGFDFCSGCNRPFKNGEKCGFSVNCKRLGLHAHHPRHCLFYLRDKEHDKLEKLLKDAGVPITRDLTSGQENQTHCQVPETKESAFGGYRDDVCGRQLEPNMAGLCKKHYVEHLGGLIFRHKVDPVPILETEELELCIRRANMRLPSKYQLTDAVYKDVLTKIVREDIPLDKVDPKQK